MTPIAYRLVIENPGASSPYTIGMHTVPSEHWCVTSLRGGQQPYVEGVPSIDGQKVDLITGKVEDGAAVVRVIDVEATVGGGVSVNDELNDHLVFNRWSRNTSGVWTFGLNWGLGAITNPAATGERGTVIGGSPTAAPNAETWLAYRMPGLTPLTDYTVSLGYYNRGHASTFGGAVGTAPFLRVGTDQVFGAGSQRPFIFSGNPPLSTIQLATISDAAGEIPVEYGIRYLGGNAPTVHSAVLSMAYGFNWVRITPGTPASTGRYATIALADSGARQQFIGRRAFIELTFDQGATWSRCIYSGFVTGVTMQGSLVYDFSLGDTRRAERVTDLFKKPQGAFTNGTPIIGGPTYLGWPPFVPFVGRPTFVVEERSASLFDVNGDKTHQGELVLKYLSGPMPDAYNATGDNLDRENFNLINERASEFWTEDPKVPERIYGGNNQGMSSGSFPQLRCEVQGIAWLGRPLFTPWSWKAIPRPGAAGTLVGRLLGPAPRDFLLGEGGRLRLPWDYPSVVNLPAVGTKVQVVLYPLRVDEKYPLHVSGHPVLLVEAALAVVGITCTNSGAMVTELGAQLYYHERVSAGETVQAFCERLYAAFGFSSRVEDGQRTFFRTLRKGDEVPTVTITTDLLREEGGPSFDLQVDSKVNQVIFEQRRTIVPDVDVFDRVFDRVKNPYDEMEFKEQEAIADLVSQWPDRTAGGTIEPIGSQDPTKDSETFGERQQAIRLSGQAYIFGVGEFPADAFALGLGEGIFDRGGRGQQGTTLVTLRGTDADDVRIGHEINVEVDHLPNAQFDRTPSSQRGGSRRMTVTQVKPDAAGSVIGAVDAGTGTQPYPEIEPLDDRWSIGVAPYNPKAITLNIDEVTLTGLYATDLIQRNARLEVEIHCEVPPLAPGAPSGSGLHYTTIDPRKYAYDPANPDTGDYRIPLGPFNLATVVWVRIRAIVPGGSPSAFSSWKSASSTGNPTTGTITNLQVIAVDDTSVSLQWDSTDTVQPVTVAWRETAIGGSYVVDDVLPPGTTRDTVTGLVANTSYDFQVSLTDGTTLTITQATTNSGTIQLAPPVYPVAIGNGSGIFGLRVIASVVPVKIVFEAAIETAIGSGTPGGYSEYDRQTGVLNTYVGSTAMAPNDGLTRWVRAKATWPGYIDSTYTTALAINPWGGSTLPLPVNPIIIPPGGSLPSLPPGTNPPGAPGGGGSLPSIPITGRIISQVAAIALAANGQSSSTMYAARTSEAHVIRATHQCRFRLYRSAAARTADAARAVNVEPYSGDALVLDVVLADADSRIVVLDPVVGLGNHDRGGSTTLYTLIDNLTTDIADIVVEVDHTPLEH